MIDAIVIADESIGDAAQLQQTIPVRVVSGKTGDFQSENDSHVSQCDFAGEASEPGALVRAGAGHSQIFIDNDHLLSGPTKLTGLVGQSVLTRGGLAVMFDLARCRL